MSETTGQEAPAVASETPTPAAATAPAESQVVDTQATTEEEGTAAPERTYTKAELQDRIERETAKAAAKAERRAYREALATLGANAQGQQQPQPSDSGRPTRHQGESDDSFIDRMTDWKLDQRTAQTEAQKVTTKVKSIYSETEKLTGMDAADLTQVATEMGATLGTAITESDMAAKLFAHLATNEAELARLKALPPYRQAAEIGKLEDKLSSAPAPRTSKAPAPINPVGSRGSAANSADLANLPMEQYIEARRKQGARWAR